MDATELLEQQHRDLEDLFGEIGQAQDVHEKQEFFNILADTFAIHSAIEERIFYPAVKAKQTEDLLGDAYQEHLQTRRLLTDCLRLGVTDVLFEGKCNVLKDEVAQHIHQEEHTLLPKVRMLLDADAREALGQEMTSLMVDLQEQPKPRDSVLGELEQNPPF